MLLSGLWRCMHARPIIDVTGQRQRNESAAARRPCGQRTEAACHLVTRYCGCLEGPQTRSESVRQNERAHLSRHPWYRRTMRRASYLEIKRSANSEKVLRGCPKQVQTANRTRAAKMDMSIACVLGDVRAWPGRCACTDIVRCMHTGWRTCLSDCLATLDSKEPSHLTTPAVIT